MICDTSKGEKSHESALLALPAEILINILSHLDEKDLYVLQQVCSQLRKIVNDEELWKNLFISQINTNHFPSFAQTPKYSLEYVERQQGLRQWGHNRAVKTKYVIAPSPRFQVQIESLLFDYPRCACYNDGVITVVQLHQRRKKDRLIYIPCTTPQGCSTMHFNINSAVFGRFDGRVFGKLLSNKSYLTPVTEFNARHTHPVTAIAASSSQDFSEDWCVSGSQNGELMWWRETLLVKQLRVSDKPIQRLALYKNWTVVLDESKIYVVHMMNEVYSMSLPHVTDESCSETALSVQHLKVDFGAMYVTIAYSNDLFVISFDPGHNFGHTRSLHVPEGITNVVADEATSRREQNLHFAGGDGCFIAVMTANNSIKVINIRSPGNTLQLTTQLYFENEVHTCQVTNLVIVCALAGSLKIFDAAAGDLIKTVQKTDKDPQFLGLSQGRMVVASRNVIQYLQYIPEEHINKKRTHSGSRAQSIRWEKEVSMGMDIYDEEERFRQETAERNQRLLEDYGGDISEEELHLRIALMESETSADRIPQQHESTADDDSDLRRVLEESRRTHEHEELLNSFADDEDDEFREAIRRSTVAERRPLFTSRLTDDFSSDVSRTDNIQQSSRDQELPPGLSVPQSTQDRQTTEEDEALQLAIALSLSEMS